MQTDFSISTPRGVLRGIAHLPKEENCPCLVLCHGLTGCAHERTLIAIARMLERNGIACLRHDCIGSGESDGASADATAATEAEDTAAVIRYAQSLPQVDAKRIAVGGHSLGALAAVMAAQEGEAAALVLLSPAFSCYHELIQLLTGPQLHRFLEEGKLDLGGFEISKAMVDELTDLDGYRMTCDAALPTLLVHGELDGESPVYHSIRLKDKLGDLATLRIIPGVHHCYETAGAQAAVAEEVRSFLTEVLI